MRDVNRIRRILKLIEEQWMKDPDMRFLQMISSLEGQYSRDNNDAGLIEYEEIENGVPWKRSYVDLFSLEDNKLEMYLRKQLSQVIKSNSGRWNRGSIQRIKIVCTGYEVIALILNENEIGMNCTMMTSKYFDYSKSNIEKAEVLNSDFQEVIISVNDTIDYELSLQLIVDYELLNQSVPCQLIQPINESSHSEIVVKIIERIDENTFLSETINGIKLMLEFETDVQTLESGDVIKVIGEMKAIII